MYTSLRSSGENGSIVESWFFYEEMARQGEYGEIVSADGQVALAQGLEVVGDFFITQLGGCSSVIDVGCGLGFPALVLAPHVGYLVAFDAAPTMVSRLYSYVKQLEYRTMSVVRSRVNELPFGNGQFDGASICGTLGSVTEPERMLKELYRVLRPNGIAVCVAENFADKLIVDAGKKFRWFRMDDGQLSLQVIEYLQNPYRIRDYRYIIRKGSELYQKLLAGHQDNLSWRATTGRGPMDLPRGTVEKVLYDEAIEFDPDSLVEAFKRTGFQVIQVKRLERCFQFRAERIMASFRRI